jgi:hypothetical protein
MKNTTKVRRLFEQMSDIAEHLTSGYRIETMSYSDGEEVSIRIRRPADTEWAVYPEINFWDNWYGTESVRFEIYTTGYGDNSLRQAQRVTTGLLAATNLVQNLYMVAEVAGFTIK